MNDWRRLLLIALIAFAAAIAGVLVGRAYVARQTPVETELHTLLHRQLELNDTQHAKIEAIERRFAVRKQALEPELRADNRSEERRVGKGGVSTCRSRLWT